MPEPGQAKFARESLLGELPDGVLAFAISVYEGGDRNTVRVGTYAETVGFTQKVSVDGLLASSVMAEDGDLLLLIHVSGQGPGEPSLKLYSTKAIADWPIRMLYERRSILPNQLLTLDARLLIIGASWIQPKSFLSPFPTHVVEVRAGTDGKWVGKRETKLDRWKPRTIALAPNGTAWCTYSNVREHGLVLVE
jgi:hypothetical protein